MGKMLNFHVKFVQTDRQTTVKQHTPDLLMRGHKNSLTILNFYSGIAYQLLDSFFHYCNNILDVQNGYQNCFEHLNSNTNTAFGCQPLHCN